MSKDRDITLRKQAQERKKEDWRRSQIRRD